MGPAHLGPGRFGPGPFGPGFMLVLNHGECMMRWRHDLHAHPELGFEEQRTSDLIAKLLAAWGI